MIKITTIGSSNAGKTCYLVATGGYKSHGTSNFEFNATNDNQREKLQKMWKSLFEENARWFSGTFNETEEFSFSCLCNGKPLVPETTVNSSENMFQWVDYRGGIWEEEQGGDDQTTEIGKLYSRSLGSDALIVVIPGDVLVKCANNPNDDDVFDLLDQYWFVLDCLCRKNLEAFQHMAVIFAITKSDQIRSETERDACVRKVQETFDFCFSSVQRACMTTMVSLGNFNVSGTQGGNVSEKQETGLRSEIAPQNLHLPILLPFYLKMREQEQETRKKRDSAQTDACYWRSRANEERNKFWLAKLFEGDDSYDYDQRAANYEKDAEKYGTLANNLSSAINNVKKEILSSSTLYEYGRQTTEIKLVDVFNFFTTVVSLSSEIFSNLLKKESN